VQTRDYSGSKAYVGLKEKLDQNSFGKELDLFVRITVRGVALAEKYKKYLTDDAETADTLVRLKTEKQYADQLTHLTGALAVLGQLVLLQIEGSDLASPESALFNLYIAKIKADKEDVLKTLLGPAVLDILNKRLEGAPEGETAELRRKIKVLQELRELE
jgi:hypothetical protein